MINESEKVRRRRSDAGSVRMTARDSQLLTLLVEHYGAPMDLVAVMAGVSTSRAYGLVSRWKRAGWVRQGQVDAGPSWVWPTQATAAALLTDADGNPGRVGPWAPTLARVSHLRATLALRLFRVGVEQGRWISERQLQTGTGMRRAGEPVGHTPDGIEVLPDGSRVLIEVELTSKGPARYFDPVRQTGVLTEVSASAATLGCSTVAYWAPDAVASVVEASIGHVRASWGSSRDRADLAVRRLEGVPGWQPPSRGE